MSAGRGCALGLVRLLVFLVILHFTTSAAGFALAVLVIVGPLTWLAWIEWPRQAADKRFEITAVQIAGMLAGLVYADGDVVGLTSTSRHWVIPGGLLLAAVMAMAVRRQWSERTGRP